MIKYSTELFKKIETIQNHYKWNNERWVFQRIMKILIDSIDIIDKKYIVLPEVYLRNYLIDANDVWEKDGNNKQLDEIKKEFFDDLNRIISNNNISINDKENIALNCILRILHNLHEDINNNSSYNILSVHIENLALLDVDENSINYLLGKYFMGVL